MYSEESGLQQQCLATQESQQHSSSQMANSSIKSTTTKNSSAVLVEFYSNHVSIVGCLTMEMFSLIHLICGIDGDGLALGVIEAVHGLDVHHPGDSDAHDKQQNERDKESAPDSAAGESHAVKVRAEHHRLIRVAVGHFQLQSSEHQPVRVGRCCGVGTGEKSLWITAVGEPLGTSHPFTICVMAIAQSDTINPPAGRGVNYVYV